MGKYLLVFFRLLQFPSFCSLAFQFQLVRHMPQRRPRSSCASAPSFKSTRPQLLQPKWGHGSHACCLKRLERHMSRDGERHSTHCRDTQSSRSGESLTAKSLYFHTFHLFVCLTYPPDYCDQNGDTALIQAALHGLDEVCLLILQDKKFNVMTLNQKNNVSLFCVPLFLCILLFFVFSFLVFIFFRFRPLFLRVQFLIRMYHAFSIVCVSSLDGPLWLVQQMQHFMSALMLASGFVWLCCRTIISSRI